MNLYSNQADGPVITIHDLPQDVSLDYLKKHLRMKVPRACLKAGFFWMNSTGKQLHILNSDQDLSEAKRTSKQGTIGLAVVVDSGMYAVFTIILQLLRNSKKHDLGRDFEWESRTTSYRFLIIFINILRFSFHIIFFTYPGTLQGRKINVGLGNITVMFTHQEE